MIKKLIPLSKEDAAKILPRRVIRRFDNESVFKLKPSTAKPHKPDPLLKLEISFRRCDRLGVFDMSKKVNKSLKNE